MTRPRGKSSDNASRLVAGAALAGALAATEALCETPLDGLTADDRVFIEEFLGPGFLGQPVAAPDVGDAREFLGLGDGVTWELLGAHGERDGQRRIVTMVPAGEESGARRWRLEFDGVNGREVREDERGSLLSYQVEDTDDGLVVRTDPPDPILMSGMRPGDVVRYRMQSNVFDAGNTSSPKYRGSLEMDHAYIGAYRVTVPAGTFDAAAFRWHFTGKVGPARIDDLQFAFYAEGVGPVAYIERKDISAFVVYRKVNRDAMVLAGQP